MRLTSERLVFSPLTAEDFDRFYELDTDPDVMRFIRKPSSTREEAMERFDRLLSYGKNHPGKGAFTVSTDSGDFVGLGFFIHLELNPENIDYEVGYRLSRSSWGKGYATEVAKTLIRYGFEELALPVIYATTNPDHIVSQKVLLKAGMQEFGTCPYYGGSKFFRIQYPLK